VRWLYTTNGQEIYEFDLFSGIGHIVEKYPTPSELYERYTDEHATIKQQMLSIPYCIDSDKKPRYYQDLAITKALTAIAQKKDRMLLTLATGTGKTYIAFQIVYKLLQAKRSKTGFNRRPRILFLADRNVLIEQAMNTFNPLEKDLLRVTGKEIKKRNGVVPINANIFFAIYQAIISGNDEDGDFASKSEIDTDTTNGYFRKYNPDFFDLIIIDECHRGGANQEGNWAEILKYFKSATQMGMTATPKRTDNVDTYNYFGEPIYEYSLKEGINDGFLTPYKVKRIQTNIDELVIDDDVTIISGEKDKDLYEVKDFDRTIIVPERIDLISKEILNQISPYDKTIVFCVDQEHAARVRDAINAHKTVSEADYCVRVTSNEGDIGRRYLERFQDNDKTIPTILTSSQMLTTGVDAKNVRNIVLLRNIGSITEFKQIIGRGTRVFDGKDYFTILDFTGATNLFYDSAWDGPPEPLESTDNENRESLVQVEEKEKIDQLSEI
jgi:type I restriction enzyme R subunit